MHNIPATARCITVYVCERKIKKTRLRMNEHVIDGNMPWAAQIIIYSIIRQKLQNASDAFFDR